MMAMTAAARSVRTIGLANWARKRLMAEGLGGCGSSLGPSFFRLASASAGVRPVARSAPRLSSSCSSGSEWGRGESEEREGATGDRGAPAGEAVATSGEEPGPEGGGGGTRARQAPPRTEGRLAPAQQAPGRAKQDDAPAEEAPPR